MSKCGGEKSSRQKHGGSKLHKQAYSAWKNMKARCAPTAKAVLSKKNYVSRGIKWDTSWHDFEAFLKDMGDPPTNQHSLDRIDNSRGYSKINCRWATKFQQARNTRFNRHLTLNGKTLCVNEWSEKLGIHRATIATRIDQLGWSVEKALTVPTRTKASRK